jgi:hypothetical protein
MLRFNQSYFTIFVSRKGLDARPNLYPQFKKLAQISSQICKLDTPKQH